MRLGLFLPLSCSALLHVATTAAAQPVISNAQHFPGIPRPSDAVHVEVRVAGATPTATLRWRADGTAGFQSSAMVDANGDGRVEAAIPALPDQTVVEFFIDAADGTGATTWPSGNRGALYQVDSSDVPTAVWLPGAQPVYRGLLTGVDRAALLSAPTDATFVGTFLSVDGTGERVVYQCQFRSGSPLAPQSFEVIFPQATPWNNRASLKINSRFPHSQAIGAAAFRRTGLPVAEAVPVQFRLNGANLAEAGPRMFQSYARVEPVDGTWLARQFPLDAGGNLYRVDDRGPGTHGELAYETPPTAANYADTYFKITNVAANDYSDLIVLTEKLSTAPQTSYKAQLGQVLNLEQWLRFLALDALLGNAKDGLQSGRGHGLSLYHGISDPRFVLVPDEFDTVLGLGENGTGDPLTRSIFSYEAVQGLNRMMNHPDILADYYAQVLELMDTVFNHAVLDPLIDQVMGGWVDAETVRQAKDFITQRRVNVNAQIPQTYGLAITTSAPDVEGMKQTTDGSAVAAGAFNVARVRSILVNGQAATLHYRTAGADQAGTWSCALTTVSGLLKRGVNVVAAKFYDEPNGAGNVVHQLTALVFYSGGAVTNISGNIGGGSAQAIFQYGNYSSSTLGSTWRYLTNGSNPGASWKDEGFNDSAWATGATQIGYGDSPRDEQTLVTRVDYDPALAGVQSAPTYYFRNAFTIADITALDAVSGEVKYDDGAAVYVNGTQVLRTPNLADAAGHESFADFNDAATTENATSSFTVPLSLLRNGMNTIAVEVHQHDPGSADLTFDLKLDAVAPGPNEITWALAGSPYRLTGDATVPAGVTLTISPGVTVFADHNTRLTVNGQLKVLGTPDARVHFSNLPGAPLQDDPRLPDAQMVPPKWGGILFVDSLSSENVVRYADFVNAQPLPIEGCITVVRSECLVDHCTFAGTYLHGVYGKNCSLTVQDCFFPDVFQPGQDPVALGLDNLSEFVEVDSAPNDPGVVGKPEFFQGFPIGGHLRLYRNVFGASHGHNDLVDVTAGKWGVTPVLDVQDNYFQGPSGDEHLDLNGDAYIAGNFFETVTKDAYTSDRGYANAVSSDVTDPETTVVVARNVFTRVDHAVNVKRDTGAIFEHNTLVDIFQDYVFIRGTFMQPVKTSAVNFFIPDDTGPTPGDGAYVAFNLLYSSVPLGGAPAAGFPRVFSSADLDVPARPQKTTKIEMAHNFLDPLIADPVIGSQHPDNVFAAVWQPRIGDPLFVDRAGKDYALLPHSPARGTAPFGLDYGATIAPGCYLGGVPASLTPNPVTTLTVGGPGIFAFQWRVDGAAWSAPVAIAPGVFPRFTPTIRTATLTTPALANGPHTLEVIGQDFAGNWQVNPTSATWTVNTALRRVVINEVLADALPELDSVELHNAGADSVSLSGWFLSDDPAILNKVPLSGTIPAGGYLTLMLTGMDLDAAGDQLRLNEGAALVDSVVFGAQIPNLSLGRVGADGHWTLCTPTPHAPNSAVALGLPDGLRINEWLAALERRFSEGWIEIANVGPAAVALGGVTITDNAVGNANAYTFPPLSFIGADGFLKLNANNGSTAGELPFTLDPQGGILTLHDGATTLDSVQFLPQTADTSMGRDTTGALVFFSRPTGGFANSTTEPTTYRPWLAWHATENGDDKERDGFSSLAEFALGTDPELANDATQAVKPGTSVDGRLQLTVWFPQNSAAAQGHGRPGITYIVQVSDDLTTPNWSTLATKTLQAGWLGPGTVTSGAAIGGLVPVTVRDSAPVAAYQQRFLRLLVAWTP